MSQTAVRPRTEQEANAEIRRRLVENPGAGDAARETLAAGRPIYYSEPETPDGMLVKEYPDGRRELVVFHREGDEVIRTL